MFEDRTCVPGTVQNGPRHNTIPNPATLPHKDNNSMWVPDFSPAHYDKMLYSKKGITERVRKDLKGPDGKPGISLAGRTMHNMYLEMSKGAYTVDGQASRGSRCRTRRAGTPPRAASRTRTATGSLGVSSR
ncbi:immune inhibitor A domain-containing protein [Micromonospora sp. b486]|uniref:immune inhibitor A domain-containing protein n=1 Tax=Micromonospora sp. b486 TaxID=3053986 RepID=UPI00259C8123|nr:immune inhibitor A domain-containing protein [Micromonospora sp. b486]MDM4784489.1 hypothetical protein [Micromonospora sp. b486]